MLVTTGQFFLTKIVLYHTDGYKVEYRGHYSGKHPERARHQGVRGSIHYMAVPVTYDIQQSTDRY